jgi:hypothetical protein
MNIVDWVYTKRKYLDDDFRRKIAIVDGRWWKVKLSNEQLETVKNAS